MLMNPELLIPHSKRNLIHSIAKISVELLIHQKVMCHKSIKVPLLEGYADEYTGAWIIGSADETIESV
jgi:hypothetical protein